jgi:hypothetical protein
LNVGYGEQKLAAQSWQKAQAGRPKYDDVGKAEWNGAIGLRSWMELELAVKDRASGDRQQQLQGQEFGGSYRKAWRTASWNARKAQARLQR